MSRAETTKPATSSLTTRGRVTVPLAVRKHLGVKGGDKIAFTMLSDGRVVLRAKVRRLSQLAGLLTRPDQPSLGVDRLSLPGDGDVDAESVDLPGSPNR